jgi:hypothetical protein
MQPVEQYRVHLILRVAVIMCFIGHGAFGIITKAAWCHYFGVMGIGTELSYRLMPLVGSLDILLGISMLVYPVRVVLAWLAGWALVTALLRPLSGEPVAEFVERAGNFGTPLAMLILSGLPATRAGWFTRIKGYRPMTAATTRNLANVLKITATLLFMGHGWLNLLGKPALLGQYASLGMANPLHQATIVGVAEITAASLLWIKPARPFLLVLLTWKMCSELFYPDYPLFEWIERGGSYGCVLALWVMYGKQVKDLWNRSGQRNYPMSLSPEV